MQVIFRLVIGILEFKNVHRLCVHMLLFKSADKMALTLCLLLELTTFS